MPSPPKTQLKLTDEARLRAVDLGDRADRAFEHLLDYIWKTPRLIEAEEKLERDKIEGYFPITGTDDKRDALHKRMRSLRAALEVPKLRVSFPSFVASANLMLSTSTFEHWCLALCKLIEEHEGIPLAGTPGTGVHRLLKFLRQFDIDLNRSAYCKQALAAIRIRNCLAHANGVVSLMSRDTAELHRIVESCEYEAKTTFEGRPKAWPPEDRGVKIASTGIGDQLVISNDYSWISSAYFHRCFNGLLAQALRGSA